MLKRSLFKTSWCKLRRRQIHDGVQSANTNVDSKEIHKIRNIGILAHIDAGKTTTTERMLYYTGLIKNMGEVHHGNTTTDYMEQERQRGITITSAVVSFDWKGFRVNLIDTPGHIDFTMEVEQTIKVQDGAIVILDGAAGVEAQTLTVCRQADTYGVPKIIYVNKMDKKDADFNMCLESIKLQLNENPLPTQLPLKVNGIFGGIIDIVSLQKVTFNESECGRIVNKSDLTEDTDGKLWELASEKRSILIDKLSGLDDKLADIIIQRESLENIPAQTLVESLQRVTIDRKGVPVLLGSSYKNMGVQPLMDAILLYLPSPRNSRYAKDYKYFGNDLSARVFKIAHSKRKGALTFLRVYTGTLQQGMKIYYDRQSKIETVDKIYSVFADDYKEISEISTGNIAAVAGLKHTVSGDLITSDKLAVTNAKSAMLNEKNINEQDVDEFFDSKKKNMIPVFFRTIEASSSATQKALDAALKELLREDPSLVLIENADTGQMEIGGMGELHLDIICDRIKKQYKVDVYMGELQIAYKETIQNKVKDTNVMKYELGNTKYEITVIMSVEPSNELDNEMSFEKISNYLYNDSQLKEAIIAGFKSGLSHGPKLCCPVKYVHVTFHEFTMKRGTSPSMLSAAISTCIQRLLRKAGVVLMEPFMELEVITLREYTHLIIADIGKKRGELKGINMRGLNVQVIKAHVPLSNLLGYSSTIRKMTSGTGTFSIEFSHYRVMDPDQEAKAYKKETGFSL